MCENGERYVVCMTQRVKILFARALFYRDVLEKWYNSLRIKETFRVRPRFFDQVGHETMYASSGNKHFFTKSCHRQTYQNYEQIPQKLSIFLENKVL